MEAGYGSQYRDLYNQHWWWRAREQVLSEILRSLRLPAAAEIIDVGCGDALSFPLLEQFGQVRGIELDRSLIDPANPRRAKISSEPLGSPCYAGWQFDLVTALDVIEHIEDDRCAMAALVALLKPGAKLVVTVPAFMCLWDAHDEVNRHFRRYRRAGLLQLLPPGVRVLQARYLFPSLFPIKWLLAQANRLRRAQVRQHSMPKPWVNRWMRRLLLAEYRLTRWLSMPFGTSLLMVLERTGGIGQG